MRRHSLLAAVLVVAAGFAAPASAAGINLNGPHYNLNIIGVENPKTAPMTGSDRHTIFVALGKKSPVASNIYLIPALFVRGKGKSTFFAVSTSLTTLNAWFDVAGVVTCETISLFDPVLQDFFWE